MPTPHRRKRWRIPPKPSGAFVAHLGDVLDGYHRPPGPRRSVVCMDETSRQPIGEVRPPVPAVPELVERCDGGDVRDGVAGVFPAFGPTAARRRAGRLEVRHTPGHGSWPNMAELEWSALARDLPERVGDRAAMVRHLAAWAERRNKAVVIADWPFTTADARAKLKKLYPTTDE